MTLITPCIAIISKTYSSLVKAFTLAEVLIVLGIIGLIADMTIPTLISSTREKVAVAKLQKAYSTFESAYRMAVAENGPPDGWDLIASASPEGAVNFTDKIIPYLKTLKYCKNKTGCFPDVTYKSLGRHIDFANFDNVNYYSKLQLADGTSILAYIQNSTCTPDCAFLRIDINGFDPPNVMGEDTFTFSVRKNSIIPWGIQNDTSYKFEDSCNISIKNQDAGRGCTAWVLYNQNMDYLHCSDLSWDGKKSCK